MTNTYARANKVSVQATEAGFEARFFRTHKHIATINSAETGWVADPNQNKTLQREMFRLWVCEHAADLEIEWDPTDRRAEANVRSPKYVDDDTLIRDTLALITPDVERYAEGCKIEGLTLKDISVDEIRPMDKSPKGTDLSKLGIIDGKYGNGNWAWAEIPVTATLTYGDTETYVTMVCHLVSGQLKKPTSIEDGGFTQTAFRNAVMKDLKDLLPKEESKTETETELDPGKDAWDSMMEQEYAEEAKTKGKGKGRSKKNDKEEG